MSKIKIEVKESPSNGGEYFVYIDGKLSCVSGTPEIAAESVRKAIEARFL